jgi:hypothetical protein
LNKRFILSLPKCLAHPPNLCQNPRMRSTRLHALKLFALVAILPLAVISPGRTTHTQAGGSVAVTSPADSGFGSFRQILADAAANPGPDTITFDSSVFPPGSPVTIHSTANYIIEAPAASDPLTIDATGSGVIFDFNGVTEGGAALHWRPDGPVSGITLKNFTIQNFAPDDHHAGHGIEFGFAPTTVSDVLIENMTIMNNQQTAILLAADESMTDVTIRNNHLEGNGHAGIALNATSMSGVLVESNNIRQNTNIGVEVEAFENAGPAGVVVSNNTIVSNGQDAIFVSGEETANTTRATISQNTTTNNGGLGINLLGFGSETNGVTENDAGDTDLGPNDLLNFPVLNGVGPAGIVGTACAFCTIELFIGDSDASGHGEGAGYFATGTADADGNFEISGCGQNEGATVTATATNQAGSTSEFSLNYTLASKPSCAHLNGDLDCDGDFDPRDALIAIIYEVDANQISRESNCPFIGQSTVPVALPAGFSGPSIFGDVNCDDLVNTGDAITLLQNYAGTRLNPEPPSNCTPIGQSLPVFG